MAELGVGYLSIIPETSKIAPGIKSALGGAEKHAEPSGKSMGGKIAGGIGSAVSTGLKTVAAGTVAAGVAGIGTAMVKGFQRLDAIDNANAKLTGLGHSAGSVKSIMDDSLASVKGTAFGLGEAASLAAGAVASGIKPGQDLQRVLSLTGDAATIAGTSMGEMGSIFNKVAATNKVQGDVLNQLGERGIPIIQMLAAEMGVTAEEAVKMASQGKIGFETFANAMESQLGGAALEGAKTVSGALANLGAAAGRLGAEVLRPAFEAAPGLIGKATDAIDGLTAKAGPAAQKIGELVGSMDFSAIGEHVGSIFSDLASTVSSSGLLAGLGSVATSVGAVASAAASASPAIVSIAGSLAEVGSSIGVSGLSLLATTLEAVAAVTSGVLAPALSTVAGFMESQTGLVTAAVVAWGAFKTVPSILARLQSATAPAAGALKGMATANESIVQTSSMGAVQMGRFGSAIGEMGKKTPIIAQMQTSFVEAAAGADRFGRMAGTAAAGMTGLRAGVKNVVDTLGGPWVIGIAAAIAAVTDIASSVQRASTAQDAVSQSAARAASAHRDLALAVGEANGAMSEQAVAAAQSIIEEQITSTSAAAEQASGMFAGLGNWIDQTTQGYDGMKSAIDGNVSAMDRSRLEGRVNEMQMAALAEAAGQLGIEMDDVSAIAQRGGPRWNQLKDAMAAIGPEGEDMANKLQLAADAAEATAEATRDAEPGAVQLAEAFRVMADEASTAADKAAALDAALVSLAGPTYEADEAMANYWANAEKTNEEIAELAVSGEKLAVAVGDGALEFNLQTQAGRDTREMFKSMRTATVDAVASGGDLAAVTAENARQMQELSEQTGYTVPELEQLAERAGFFKDPIELALQMVGSDEAAAEIAMVSQQLKGVDEGAKINVGIISDDAFAALEELDFEVKKLDNGSVEVTAKTEEARQGIENVATAVGGLDGKSATTVLKAEAADANNKISALFSDLADLDEAAVSPEVEMIIEKFMQGRDISVEELENLDTTLVSPEAQLLIAQLLAESARANADLDNTARPRTATITPQLAAGSLGSIQEALNSMSFSVPVSALPSLGGLAAGARIPRRATGGRLPTTGPGTERTDGILGVDSRTGQPTSFVDAGEWVIKAESSEEYDGVLGMINRDDPRVQHLKKFQQGGRVGRATKQDLLDLAWGRTGEGPPLEGNPYRYGQIKWGDCSSAQYAFAAKAVGLPPFGARFSTSTMSSELRRMGATMGSLGGDNDYNVGWYGHGTTGHTVGAIGRTNVEMGGGYGGGKIGGTANPWQSIYTQKAHIPLAQASGSAPAATGAGTSGTTEREPERTDYSRGSDVDRMDAPRSWTDVAGIAAKSAAEGYTSDLLSLFGLGDELPPALRAAQEWKASERARAERIADRDEAYSPGGGASGSGSGGARQSSSGTGGGDRDVGDPGGKPATGWGDMVTQALDFVGLGEGLKTKVLGRIDDISGGDPDYVATAPWTEALARHNSGQGIDMALAESTAHGVFSALQHGAAMGLMGVTAGEFAHYCDQELPDDEFHPMANVVARLNEAIATYGSIEKAWASAPGYWNGGTVRDSRDVLPAWLAPGEEVTRTADAQRGGNRDVLQAMRNGATFSADAPGPEVHNHYHVSDVDGALRRQRIHEGEQALTVTGGGPIW